MCHAFLADTNFYQLLTRIDESIAEEVRAGGCDCGGALHSARYPRKPRGVVRGVLDESYQSRLSFCCAADGCRRRSTPPSVRFLGRKVYLGVIVVLISALHDGLSASRRQRLIKTLGVTVQTLRRWQHWWREQFVQTRCFRSLAGLLMPPIATEHLPGSLLEKLSAKALSERVVQLLILIAPSTTATGSL
ncbi:hypothetical protein [Thiorhodovibrio litoralis]|uniref:hypothetical protein n=1 Tax=Thiorhodovibrio litoralis TaxID=2952932 RepID=UPI002B25F392|nr:hypothetical protein [Thiorhodovibrio litoralis]WPL13558.1 hypothetical protein Thiosp_03365 [Thiorhodovibrio litoralis]